MMVDAPQYEAWEPIRQPPTPGWVTRIEANDEGLIVVVRQYGAPESRRLRLRFKAPAAYSFGSESHRERTWQEMDKPIGGGTFVKLSNSPWVLDLGLGTETTHFAIFGEESCLDIIASSEPEASWMGPVGGDANV